MEEKRLQIAYGQTPKVLLIGNGFNRAYGFASWNELIELIRTKELDTQEKKTVENIPYPFQPVILTGDHLGTQMKNISGQLAELCAPQDEEELLRSFANLPFDGILTANYTYELEKAISQKFKCMPARRCKERKVVHSEAGEYSKRQLHTCFMIEDYPPVWHIHGEASRHDTMILGHYYYGKLLAKMQQYMSKLISRYKASQTKQQEISVYSWLDYFMLGEVYIVGLGMDLSEMDLWWLMNCKKRHFPDRKVILFKPDIKTEEKLLAEAYGVVVETGGFNGDYTEYYKWIHETLKETLK